MIDTRIAEREDVLAYLARRKANCLLMAAKSPEFADAAKVQARQLGILIDEITAGLHECEAEVARVLAVDPAAHESAKPVRLSWQRLRRRLKAMMMLATGRI